MSASAEKKDAEKKDPPKEGDKKDGEQKDGEKKDAPADNVDKDYVIFHFPGIEQKDGTSAGCETLKIPREAAIGLVQKAPPLPDKITQQMSFIKISCGKCGAEQVMDPAQTAAIKAPAAAAAAAQAAAPTPGASTSTGCTGPAMMNLVSSVPGSNTHIQFTCNCLEQFGIVPNSGGGPLPPIPHAPTCCYSLGGSAKPTAGGGSPSRGHHNDRVRDRLIAEERRMRERYEEDEYGSPRRRSYQEFEERRTYGNGGRSRSSRDFDDRGRHGHGHVHGYEEDLSDVSEGGDDEDGGRYALRRTSSGNVAIIGDDNCKVRVEVGGRRSEGRRRGYR